MWIGAKQPRMLRLLAKYADAYNTVWHREPSPAIEAFARVDAACAEVGRDPSTLMKTSGSNIIVPGAGDAEDAGSNVISGSVDQIAEQIWAFHTEAGVSHMTFIIDPWTTKAIEQFGKVIEKIESYSK